MLMMVKKGIRVVICHSIYQHAKTNNKCIKDYGRNKKLSYFQYQDVNDSYGWTVSQKLLVNNFQWIKDTSQFNEDFIRNYNEESDEGHFLKVDVQYPKKLHERHDDLLFLPKTKSQQTCS